MINDLSNKKVGDLVFVIGDGWLPIAHIIIDASYPIVIGNASYTLDGKKYTSNKYPSVFAEWPFKWSEPKEFEEGEEVLALDFSGKWLIRKYSKFENGEHYCLIASNGRFIRVYKKVVKFTLENIKKYEILQ